MKKIIALIFTAIVATSAMTATDLFTVGVRGIYQRSIGTTYEKEFDELWRSAAKAQGTDLSTGIESKSRNGGGVAFFVKYPLGKRFGAQVEAGYMYNVTGFKASFTNYSGSVKENISYSTLNAPLLLTFDIIQAKNFLLTPVAGIQFAFPVGKTGDWAELPINTYVLVGAVVGVSATIKFGSPIGLVIDGRYNIGFNTLKADGVELFTPRGLQISAGLQYML